MSEKQVKDRYIRVDLGGGLWSLHSDASKEDFFKEAVEQIKRHVDRVVCVEVITEYWEDEE